MMNRNLSRRLERFEEEIAPLREIKVWQIVYVHADGSRTDGKKIEWSPPRAVNTARQAVPAFRKRYR
jgi:hypothetical protein